VTVAWIDTLLKVGSVAGLIGIFYQLQQNRRSIPSLSFDFEEKSVNADEKGTETFFIANFVGIVKNASFNCDSC
jgi:hypothetical protein